MSCTNCYMVENVKYSSKFFFARKTVKWWKKLIFAKRTFFPSKKSLCSRWIWFCDIMIIEYMLWKGLVSLYNVKSNKRVQILLFLDRKLMCLAQRPVFIRMESRKMDYGYGRQAEEKCSFSELVFYYFAKVTSQNPVRSFFYIRFIGNSRRKRQQSVFELIHCSLSLSCLLVTILEALLHFMLQKKKKSLLVSDTLRWVKERGKKTISCVELLYEWKSQ